jgi:tRNA pseudouridine55 synthase
MNMNGILNVNKPGGMTSFGVVSRLKRLTGEKRIGHTGTLDPIATGVLPICFGKATRIVQYLINSDKAYLADIQLGIATDTFDREGTVVSENDPGDITIKQVEEVLSSFQGTIEQIPPRFSAVKHHGKRSCDLTRAGIDVEMKPRRVRINRIELVNAHLPVITVLIECSKGTYIRTIADDTGKMLGCGAHIKELTRTGCGTFNIEDALSLSDIERIYARGNLETYLQPVDSPLQDWQTVVLTGEDESAVGNGRSIALDDRYHALSHYCRAYNSKGEFTAILRYSKDEELWHPDKVFTS